MAICKRHERCYEVPEWEVMELNRWRFIGVLFMILLLVLVGFVAAGHDARELCR